MTENNKTINSGLYEQNKRFKYPIGKCKSIKCGKDEGAKKLLGYSWFNTQIIDNGSIYPSGEREKVPTCLDCFLYEKPMMEDRKAEEKIRYPAIIPYKWFYFYNEEDEEKYPND
ncbi:4218_t:CDS:1 [Ambispora gerdemannii]|uniref:4218_t:CDS:1 n=1 Tax=Ambispora gerdemannii TaxID=144530 RepID=A0A9N9DUB4_9GLOM|nr:4218_t:CDS:1 [Ambispora gerdemannii]